MNREPEPNLQFPYRSAIVHKSVQLRVTGDLNGNNYLFTIPSSGRGFTHISLCYRFLSPGGVPTKSPIDHITLMSEMDVICSYPFDLTYTYMACNGRARQMVKNETESDSDSVPILIGELLNPDVYPGLHPNLETSKKYKLTVSLDRTRINDLVEVYIYVTYLKQNDNEFIVNPLEWSGNNSDMGDMWRGKLRSNEWGTKIVSEGHKVYMATLNYTKLSATTTHWVDMVPGGILTSILFNPTALTLNEPLRITCDGEEIASISYRDLVKTLAVLNMPYGKHDSQAFGNNIFYRLPTPISTVSKSVRIYIPTNIAFSGTMLFTKLRYFDGNHLLDSAGDVNPTTDVDIDMRGSMMRPNPFINLYTPSQHNQYGCYTASSGC